MVTASPGMCPLCGNRDHPRTRRERRPNGDTTCGSCGAKMSTANWERFNRERDTASMHGFSWDRQRIAPARLEKVLPPHPIEFVAGDTDAGRSCGRCGFSVPGGFKNAHADWCQDHGALDETEREELERLRALVAKAGVPDTESE